MTALIPLALVALSGGSQVHISSLPVFKGWSVDDTWMGKRARDEPWILVRGGAAKSEVRVWANVIRFDSTERVNQANERAAWTNAYQFPLSSKAIESYGLRLYEFRERPQGRLAPVKFYVRGVRGLLFYEFRLERKYKPNESTPTKGELGRIVVTAVGQIVKAAEQP